MGQSIARKKKNKLLEAQNFIDSKHFSRKQNVSLDNVFLFETLHVFDTSYYFVIYQQCLIAIIAALCHVTSQPQVKNLTNVYIILMPASFTKLWTSQETLPFFGRFKRPCL